MNQQDIDELTEVFVEESQEIVENLNKDVLDLEKYVGDPSLNRELLNNIFRYIHTLKGNSGLAGADKLRELAHKMESLLDKLRKDKLTLTAVMVDLLFEGIDRISSILQEVITGNDQGVVIEDLIEKLEAILTGQPIEAQVVETPEAPAQIAQQQGASQPIPSGSHLEGVGITSIPDDIKRVLTEYEENRLRENIAKHAKIYEAILNLFMEGFDLIVTTVIEHINRLGEVIAKVPSSKTIPGYDLQVRIIFASAAPIEQLSQSLTSLTVLEKQNVSLRLLLDPEGTVSAAKETITLQAQPSPTPQEKPVVSEEVAKPTVQVKPESVPTVQAKPVKEEKPELSGKPTAPSVPKELAEPGNTIKVDIKKLDNLMNIVGELVLAKARYIQIESELEGVTEHKTLRNNLKKNNKSTSKKLEDLREAILQVRMVQIGTLFNRYPRIVRDEAKKYNKQIQLVLEGQETELDKAVVDEMGVPLIHLVRNAIGHGIEDPEIRRQRGKPETGTITLRAYQEGSYIVIEIQDDGAGMDIERIREKAIETGLIDKGSKLSDNEILNFIFHPGFSTAKKITDTSGRGVGMDAVKLTIAQLKGIIDIQTALGIGTTFIVKLPLTLAIIQVLLIRINNHTYAIPLSSVIESFKLNPEKIEIVDGQEVTQLRDVVLSLLRLKEAFGLEKPTTRLTSQPQGDNGNGTQRNFVVVIGLAEKKIGLVVDDLLGQQEIVIKPLGRYLVNTPGFAGAATLGDGKIILILDVVGLIESLNVKKMEKTKRKGKGKKSSVPV